LKPKDGYGEYNDEAVQTLPKEQFAGIELSEGMSLYGQGEHGETIQVVVKSFDDTNVTIDYNHPMAGRTLMFSVAILSFKRCNRRRDSIRCCWWICCYGWWMLWRRWLWNWT
jgi:FKBP-type peptidyl-prolyl cis-trans isomerase SlyD